MLAFASDAQLPSTPKNQSRQDDNSTAIRHGFKVGSLPLLVPLSAGGELLQAADICPIPNAPPWFSGFINHRGNIVPVFALDLLFSSERTPLPIGKKLQQNPNRLLLLGRRQEACALQIDAYPQTLSHLQQADVPDELAIPELLRAHLSAVLTDGAKYWIDFHHQAFFASLKTLF